MLLSGLDGLLTRKWWCCLWFLFVLCETTTNAAFITTVSRNDKLCYHRPCHHQSPRYNQQQTIITNTAILSSMNNNKKLSLLSRQKSSSSSLGLSLSSSYPFRMAKSGGICGDTSSAITSAAHVDDTTTTMMTQSSASSSFSPFSPFQRRNNHHRRHRSSTTTSANSPARASSSTTTTTTSTAMQASTGGGEEQPQEQEQQVGIVKGMLRYFSIDFSKNKEDGMTVKERLAKMGMATLLTYGWVSNMNSIILTSLSWYVFNVRTRLSPLAPGQWKPFLGVYAGFYVISSFLRPFRVAAAIAMGPSFDKAIQWIQDKTQWSKAVSTAVMVVLANLVCTCIAMAGGIVLASLFSGVPIWATKVPK